MLFANFLTIFLFCIEAILYLILGLTIYRRPQGIDCNKRTSSEKFLLGFCEPSTTTSTTTTTTTTTPTTTTTTTPTTTTTTQAPGPLTICFPDDVSVCNACKDITSMGGTIQSPNFPNDYGNNQGCTYTIEVPAGKKIKMILSTGAQLDLNTGFEELKFFEGVFPPTPTFLGSASGPFPTSATQEFTTTSSNKAQVVFNSDSTACTATACKWEVKYVVV